MIEWGVWLAGVFLVFCLTLVVTYYACRVLVSLVKRAGRWFVGSLVANTLCGLAHTSRGGSKIEAIHPSSSVSWFFYAYSCESHQ